MSLLLDLLRHGLAAASADGGDAARPLTSEGALAIERLADSLAREPQRPERVLSSPLLRARQTSEIVAARLALAHPVEIRIELEAERDPAGALEAIAGLGFDSGHLMVVGHQPQIGRLVAQLTGADHVRVAPGTLVRIRCLDWPRSRRGELLFTRDTTG